MIIYCEECGAKNILPDESSPQTRERIRCQYCHDFLLINRKRPPDAAPPAGKSAGFSRLVIQYHDLLIDHCGPGRRITMGRNETNDIQVVDERVSRLHAVIEYKQGKFCLSDQSLNGTFILIRNRQGRIINHKEIMLVNQGVIGLGGVVDESSPDAIHYRIESPQY